MNVQSTVFPALLLALTVAAGLAASPHPAEAWPEQARQTSSGAVRVTGVVRDQANAIPLPGLPVQVTDTGQTVYTDVDGRYLVTLPPGQHTIKVTMEGYRETSITITVGNERAITADVALTMNAYAESVTVRGSALDAPTSTAEGQMIERRGAQVITDNLGSREMSENGDRNAASAMQRVTGLSVVDDFVFVRGLGERYSNTTLNGSVVPTTEPDRKVVPLDLFPTGLLDNVQVAKSYVPDRSAEFAGGLVQIESLKLPHGPKADFSYRVGGNSLTTGRSLLRGQGGQNFFGYDNGTRSLPGDIPDKRVIRGGRFTPDVGVLRPELERLGELFQNAWTPVTASGSPLQSVSLVAGDRFGKLGLLGSYTQSYNEQSSTEKQIYYRTSDEGLTEFSNYDVQIGTRRQSVGAIGNVGLQFNTSNRIAFENFYTHTGKDEARDFEGFNSDIATDIRNSRLFWTEEDLMSNGLSGDHFFGSGAGSAIDWRVTYARANRDEPDVREVLYERNGPQFVLADESQSGFRMFNTLDDRTIDASANWSFFSTTWMRFPVQVKFGASYVDRERDFMSRRFRFIPTGVSVDLTQTPEQLFTPANIGPGAPFELREETRTTDTYDAQQTVGSFYGMTDFSLSARLRLVAGARVERSDQEVNTYDPFDFEGDPELITARLKNTDVFPAVNVIYAATPRHNLRLSFSQTTNRPEFRELAPFEFTDIVGGRAVVGNPNLKRALIQNVDARWEMFPGGAQVVAASVFYKHFNDPIERIVEPTAQLRTSYTNARSARNLGLELEARRQVTEMFALGANYTFVDSNITLEPAAEQVQTSLDRPLAGQSRHLFNAMLELGPPKTSVRVLYNFFGERISDVGSLGLPDIYEDGRGSLDLALSSRWSRLTLQLVAGNLTDEPFTFKQGGKLQREYGLGRTFTFTVSFSSF